jgi:RNA polymerase sigma-70 factor (sigma-E family)
MSALHDEGFAELFTDTHGAMVRMAYLMTRNHADAEDAVARAYAKVFPRWRTGAMAHPRAYLRTAVTNEVVSGFRRQGTRTRHQHLLASDDRSEPAAEEHLAARDEMAAALARLPLRQRTVLVLRYYEQLSEREIAEVMGVSTGTVKSTAARGLDRLRQVLEPAAARPAPARVADAAPHEVAVAC